MKKQSGPGPESSHSNEWPRDQGWKLKINTRARRVKYIHSNTEDSDEDEVDLTTLLLYTCTAVKCYFQAEVSCTVSGKMNSFLHSKELHERLLYLTLQTRTVSHQMLSTFAWEPGIIIQVYPPDPGVYMFFTRFRKHITGELETI